MLPVTVERDAAALAAVSSASASSRMPPGLGRLRHGLRHIGRHVAQFVGHASYVLVILTRR